MVVRQGIIWSGYLVGMEKRKKGRGNKWINILNYPATSLYYRIGIHITLYDSIRLVLKT
jgi:hypothetical protein